MHELLNTDIVNLGLLDWPLMKVKGWILYHKPCQYEPEQKYGTDEAWKMSICKHLSLEIFS